VFPVVVVPAVRAAVLLEAVAEGGVVVDSLLPALVLVPPEVDVDSLLPLIVLVPPEVNVDSLLPLIVLVPPELDVESSLMVLVLVLPLPVHVSPSSQQPPLSQYVPAGQNDPLPVLQQTAPTSMHFVSQAS